MKKLMLVPLTALLICGAILTASAQQPRTDAKMAKDKQNEKDILAFNKATKKDYDAEYKVFKKAANAQVESNSKKI